MKDLNPLFQGRPRVLLPNITLDEDQRQMLIDARNKVRATLRKGLPALIAATVPAAGAITPRFLTQGSYAYKTINRHCHPCQQIYMDDGCYLPMSFAKEFEVGHASDLFFAAVERLLAPLAREEGWDLVTDKPTCVRLDLGVGKNAHVDVPLYAIPDDEFATLKALAFESLDFADQRWDALPTARVLLAIRGGKWKPSDPRPIRDWVANRAELKGPQWRRCVRYLKAWRDFVYPEGGPSSILLMVSMDKIFRTSSARDDVALLEVLDGLPAVLQGPVINPTDPDRKEDLAERMDEAGIRGDVLERVMAFSRDLRTAIHGPVSDEQSCHMVRAHMGDRFPLEPSWIKLVTISEVVRNTPAKENPSKPFIRTTKSG